MGKEGDKPMCATENCYLNVITVFDPCSCNHMSDTKL